MVASPEVKTTPPGAAPLSPELGGRKLPLSAKTLPEDYRQLVLRAQPRASEEDLVEAYLGYGAAHIPNYRCWCRMVSCAEAGRGDATFFSPPAATL